MAVSGIGSALYHEDNFATFFLTTAAAYAASFLLPVRQFTHVLLVIVSGWFLCLLALASLPHYGYAFAFLGGLNLPNPVFHFAIGFGLLLGFWRFLSPAQPMEEVALGSGRLWFWGIFAAAIFMRFQHIGEAPGAYWDDPAVCIIDPQGILNFHEYVMLFPLGQREPFFSYFLAGLWSLDPHAHAILIQRLGGAILDLAAVVVFYFAGKEAGGVVTGLVAEAAAAFSKPLLIENLIGMTAVTVPLAVGLLLLTTIRLFKKQDWARFLQWALALGFAPYNYTPVRTWLPFIVTVVFLWIWFFKLKERPKAWPEYILGWGLLLVWNVLFLKVNNFLPENLLSFAPSGKIGAAAALLALFGFCAFGVARQKELARKSLLPLFFAGVALAAGIIYPLAAQPDIAVHTSGLSIFHNQETRTFHYENTLPAILIKKTMSSLISLFYGGQDRGDLNLPWDAFYEFHFAPLFMIGLAAFLNRPTWLKLFLLAASFVGISAHVLSIDPHSAKLVAAVAPMAILSGLGLQEFLAELFRRKARLRPWVAGFFVLYLGWAFAGTYDRVWEHY
ncbi:MAG TPA: hypothetical protein VMU88_05660, partial [bacterium]|nr:hypothetical protein [bacterium]